MLRGLIQDLACVVARSLARETAQEVAQGLFWRVTMGEPRDEPWKEPLSYLKGEPIGCCKV